MAVTELIDLTTDELGDWFEADLTGIHTCYVLAVKDGTSTAADLIDLDKVVKVGFELGIETGLLDDDNEPIIATTQYLILDFKDETSREPDVNDRTAFTRLDGVPSKLYIKPLFVDLDKERIYDGKVDIRININK